MNRVESFAPTRLFDQFLSRYRYSRVFSVLKKHHSIKTIYDLGCGKGELVDILYDQGYDAKGVDLEAGHRVIAANLNFALPIQDNSTDCVTTLANIEHLEQPDVNLSEIYRILKPGGHLILTTPSTAAKPVLEFLAFKLKLIDEREILDHKRYYSKETLTKALQKAGFNKPKVGYFQLGFNLHAYARK